ncbi:hypothetical protein OQH60_04260 [Campylobacter sp. MIT 21-1685]|uniref:flagellar assembly protein A n=1 Tax=unclassified Campylobacter TaxID=2593542 RepID=UPI00224B4B6E|nr:MULTISPECIES: flagellar assembly protein A [unclassified Campylobacter]MCX2683075.1 hypothetical protein [Campylobacter sp. MIT 21-1684]MCX2751357.1 hypothetical protein [Campylobacter sp. MIT 21-1682]MCX2807556.1 hypothetical protein [Campylobacter sp. MIT 21-1685]
MTSLTNNTQVLQNFSKIDARFSKTLTSFDPFESLKLEQEKTDIKLDFTILEIQTCASNNSINKIYSLDELDIFYDDEYYIKKYDVLSQQYLIKISPKNKKTIFRFILESNKNLTKIRAKCVYSKGLVYYEEIKDDIMQALYKAMIKNKILILRLDKKLNFYLDIFIETLKQGRQKLEPLQFTLCDGVEPLNHKESKTIIHKNCTKNGDFQPVESDSLLFEFIYGKEGRNGRNVCGNLISLENIDLENPFKIKNESIYEKQSERGVRYYSSYYGFLIQDDEGNYSITDTLKVPNCYIENYNKGYLETDTIYIKNLSYSTIVANNVYVERCVGSVIKAKNIFIETLFNNNQLYPKKNLIIQNECKNYNKIHIASSVFKIDQEYHKIQELSSTINMDFKKLSRNIKKIYDYLINNQVRIIKLKKHIENNEQANGHNAHLASINMYNDSLEKYERLVKQYEEFVKIKYRVDYKRESLQKVFSDVKIHIQAKEIYENNTIQVQIGKNRSNYVLKDEDKEKVFYYDYNHKNIKSTQINENTIDNIKKIFESIKASEK